MPSSSGVQQNVGASYAAAVQALLEDGPLQGTTVEVEAVEGRPPKTVDVPDDKGGLCRYCLAEWTQEGMTGRAISCMAPVNPFTLRDAKILRYVLTDEREALEAVGLRE
jgi:hypothetical protein